MVYADLGAGTNPSNWSNNSFRGYAGGGVTQIKEGTASGNGSILYKGGGGAGGYFLTGGGQGAKIAQEKVGEAGIKQSQMFASMGYNPQVVRVSPNVYNKLQGLPLQSYPEGSYYQVSRGGTDFSVLGNRRAQTQEGINYISKDGYVIGEENPYKQQSILYNPPVPIASGDFKSNGSLIPIVKTKKSMGWIDTYKFVTRGTLNAGEELSWSLAKGGVKSAYNFGWITSYRLIGKENTNTLFPAFDWATVDRRNKGLIPYEDIDTNTFGGAIIIGAGAEGASLIPFGTKLFALGTTIYGGTEAYKGFTSGNEQQFGSGAFIGILGASELGADVVKIGKMEFKEEVGTVDVPAGKRTIWEDFAKLKWNVKSFYTAPSFEQGFSADVLKARQIDVKPYSYVRTRTTDVYYFGVEAGTRSAGIKFTPSEFEGVGSTFKALFNDKTGANLAKNRLGLKFIGSEAGNQIALKDFAGFKGRSGEFWGDAKGIPAPESALEGNIFKNQLKLSASERQRIDIGIEIGRNIGKDLGFPSSSITARNAFMKIEGWKNPEVSSGIVESFAKKGGYQVFGSSISELLPVGRRNVKIGDIDLFSPKRTVQEIGIDLKNLESSLQASGENVRISPTGKGTILEFAPEGTGQGKKLLEVKSGINQAEAGLEDIAPAGVYGFRFSNVKAGEGFKTVPFGEIKGMTAGEQTLRKFAGSMIVSKGQLAGETPSFSEAGILGKQGNPRGLKDVAGFVQFSQGLGEIRQTSFNPFTKSSGTKTISLTEEFIKTYTSEQQADILGKYQSITGSKYELKFENPFESGFKSLSSEASFGGFKSSFLPIYSSSNFKSSLGNPSSSSFSPFSSSFSPSSLFGSSRASSSNYGFKSPSNSFMSPSGSPYGSSFGSPYGFKSPLGSPYGSSSPFSKKKSSTFGSLSPYLSKYSSNNTVSNLSAFNFGREGNKKKSTININVPFKTKYFASIEATAFGIKGKHSKNITGLELRPIGA